jgi:hypothetical protein
LLYERVEKKKGLRYGSLWDHNVGAFWTGVSGDLELAPHF